MEKKNRTPLQKFLIILVIFLIIMVLGLGAGIWLYSGRLSPAKLTVFKVVRLPLGKVGSVRITPKELAQYEKVAPVINKSTALALTDALKLEAVAQGKVKIFDADIDEAAKSVGGDDQYKKAVTLASVSDARDTLVRSYVIDAKLRAWYVSQPSLEPTLATKLMTVQKSLANGTPFEQLAKDYSEDSATKWFSGDAGYVNLDEAIPEYRGAVANVQKNKPTVIYSRYGIHIVEVMGDVEKDNTRLVNLREIVLTPKNYDAWLAKEKEKVPVVWYAQ